MKKVLVMVALVMVSVIVYAFNDSGESNQGKKEVTGNRSSGAFQILKGKNKCTFLFKDS